MCNVSGFVDTWRIVYDLTRVTMNRNMRLLVYPLTAHALSGETNPIMHLNLDVLLTESRQRNGTCGLRIHHGILL